MRMRKDLNSSSSSQAEESTRRHTFSRHRNMKLGEILKENFEKLITLNNVESF